MSQVEPGYYWARYRGRTSTLIGWVPIRIAIGKRGPLEGLPILYTCSAHPNYTTRLQDWEIGERLVRPGPS